MGVNSLEVTGWVSLMTQSFSRTTFFLNYSITMILDTTDIKKKTEKQTNNNIHIHKNKNKKIKSLWGRKWGEKMSVYSKDVFRHLQYAGNTMDIRNPTSLLQWMEVDAFISNSGEHETERTKMHVMSLLHQLWTCLLSWNRK